LDAAQLLSEHHDIVFVIRGVGEKAAGLKDAISERGLANVVLGTHFLPNDELTALLDSADVFVLPMADMNFVEQGLPTKVFEYQSYGKPVLCVSGGEPARYIESTHSGLIVKHNDVNSFIANIISLYNDKKLTFELGVNGRQYVSKYLTVEKIGDRMCNVFSSIIPGCSKGLVDN
jgi:glycosyltransferase involved in cell wall biosynthesis